MFGRVTSPVPALGRQQPRAGRLPAVRGDASNGVVVPCVNLTAAEIALLEDDNMTRDRRARRRPGAGQRAAVVRDLHVRPGPQTWLIVAAPPPGFMYTDPVAHPGAAEPNAIDPAARRRQRWRRAAWR